MVINSFLDSLYLNNNKNVYVVYPDKEDIETYSLKLETVFYERYKQKLNVDYIEYKDHLKDQNKTYLIDPSCYLSIINKQQQTLNKIKEEINNGK